MAESYLPSPTKARRSGRIRGLLATVLLLTLVALLLFYRQAIIDQVTVWRFQPSADIQAINTDSHFSPGGTFYFYASQPVVNTAEQFNAHCERKEEYSAILGCYDGQRIYIYDVTDERLKGIREVTAAHEMLHAAWDRLNESERDELGKLLEVEMQKHMSEELQERMAYYDRTQPGERDNELHSIIATEIADISPELETHYARYFTDRKALVAEHDAYNKVFKDLEDQSNALLGQINELRASIDVKKETYDAAYAAVQQEDAALQQQLASLDRSSASEVDAYNSRAASYNNQLESLRAEYQEISRLISEHNQKVADYNETVVSRQKLQDSIDSLKEPQA